MAYHDRNQYETRWSTPNNKKKETENPRITVISPQKKLHDIQQLLNKVPEESMTMYELHQAIQKILDGE